MMSNFVIGFVLGLVFSTFVLLLAGNRSDR